MQAIEDFLATPVSLSTLELLVIEVPQKEVFVSAIGERQSRQALIVKWTDKDGDVGYGECSCRPDPFYSHEFVSGAVAVIEKFIFPLIAGAATYGQVVQNMQKVRGWNFTRAAIEFAMNDMLRRKTGRGILEHSGWQPLSRVPVGISLGMFPAATALQEKLTEIAAANYQRLKFKISPGYNNPEITDRLRGIDHPYIAFDANGSFTARNFPLLAEFAALGHIIEQPFPPGAIYLREEYLHDYPDFAICLDEDIESYGNLVSLRPQMQEVNIKPGRVGGLYTTLKMLAYCRQQGLTAWIGGMFETGIGRAQNLQIAALLPEARAHDLSPSGRYFARDVLAVPITMEDGFIEAASFARVTVDDEAMKSMATGKIILKND